MGVPIPPSQFVFIQSMPSAAWTIIHNLACRPTVTVINSAGDVILGTLSYPDQNTVVVAFGAAFSGTAYVG